MRKIKVITVKSISITIVLFVILSAFSGVLLIKETSIKENYIVVIDAGHGGIDGGASGVNTGAKESEINLIIAKKMQEKFTKLNVLTVMTRAGSEGLYGDTQPGFKKRDLQKRIEIINSSGADLAISIHQNKYESKSRRGAQAFFKKNNEKSENLAKTIQSHLNGMRLSPRILSHLSGDYYLLNESKIPTAIVECGFLSNPEDEALLLTDSYRNDLADAIVLACLQFLSV